MSKRSIVIGILIISLILLVATLVTSNIIKEQKLSISEATAALEAYESQIDILSLELDESLEANVVILDENIELNQVVESLSQKEPEAEIKYIDRYKTIDEETILKYFYANAIIGNISAIEDFNRVMGHSIEKDDYRIMSDYIRVIVSNEDTVFIDVQENETTLMGNAGDVILKQWFKDGFGSGVRHITFVDYGINELCEAINTNDVGKLVKTFGEDGIDDTETARSILDEMIVFFENDVTYEFTGYDYEEVTFHYLLTDGRNTQTVSIGIRGDGALGYFIFEFID